jgi:phytoene desaturase
MSKHFIVVGAGVGGLGVAMRLAHRGHRVTVVEKTDAVGGRNRREQVGQSRFDGGPTLLMMLDPFKKLFADVGEDFDTRVPNRLCDPSYRVFFADGTRFDGTTNVPVMTERIRTMSGDAEAAKYPGFLSELKALYEESIPHFVRKNYRSLWDFASPAQLKRVLQHHMLGNLAKRIKQRFQDKRLQMIFSFQTMYLGLSPNDAPWVYATLAYMEYGEGIFYPEGGLGSISDTMAQIAQEKGVQIRLNSPVEKIEGRRVHLVGGEIIEGDVVVANADMPYAQRELAAAAPKRNLRYSCSAHLMYIDYEGDLEGFEHHNVVFGADFDGNLDAIFHNLRLPEDPAFYVCISKRSDPEAAPDGRINLFVLVPCPNLDCPMDESMVNQLEGQVFDRLAKEGGFDRTKVREIKRRGPNEWRNELNLERGAAFGISHDLFQSAFMRPQNRSKSNPDLYFVGASTVPGNGLPMVLISAELIEERLIHEGVIPA